MPGERSMREVLHNMLQYGDLSFRDFVELALYHPEFGYYARPENPVGKAADFVSAPALSPAFSFAIGRLVSEFMSREEGGVSTVVDIGCGDGGLIQAITMPDANFYGVDRSLSRATQQPSNPATFVNTLDEVPKHGTHLLFSNELFDAFPFARLVQRGEDLHELYVDSSLDWVEHEAPAQYEDYLASHAVELEDGQFADVSLEWEAYYGDLARGFERALIVTIDYGFEARKLFHPRIRRFGTAAAYASRRVSRDLLANPGEQDLTAHINFSDLRRAGEREGCTTLFFDGLAKFLLALGITRHELFRPVHELESSGADENMRLLDARDEARRLVLPDGIGEDLRVLVQGRGVPLEGWSFQKKLF